MKGAFYQLLRLLGDGHGEQASRRSASIGGNTDRNVEQQFRIHPPGKKYKIIMTRQHLIQQIQTKKSYLCVGLDTDITRIPKHLQSRADAVFEFNKKIIDATKDL